MSSSGRYEPIERPLFGESRATDSLLHYIIAGVVSLSVLLTLVFAFVFPKWPPRGVNIMFAGCIAMLASSHLLLVYWYRQGDLEPRFRRLIYFNSVAIFLLCVCANLYFHNV
ncbi:hypothetical protein BOX15_Mlig031342g3 [Macrostomum lignano]|uniref:Uncharacterized protein n=2 Tax=Macrostomum lignano TaxID=282301 RepID=A0A267G4H3_9PLAT|nr:hypothetical protein BOX15_Mlig031342g1 [Macrostomum lignano]PAA80229.1 hypothetical protein BOX15_Mlig031342g4 [Macrostomum lignano]PAA84605.1 hypothetical protein BOX15_Mlig031342g3 [Macrostomum lignano]